MSGICVVDNNVQLNSSSMNCLLQRGDKMTSLQIPIDSVKDLYMYQLGFSSDLSFVAHDIPLLWHGDLSNDDFNRLSTIRSMTDNFIITQLIVSIKRPFAFVYYNAFSNKLLFGHDAFGIRNLIRLADKDLLLSSVALDTFNNYEDTKAGVIFALNLRDECLEVIYEMPDALRPLDPRPHYNQYEDFVISALKKYIQELNFHPAVMFSGGLDSAVLARILDLVSEPGVAIDLLNTCATDDAPDRQTGLRTLDELRLLSPKRKFNFVQINPTTTEISTERKRSIASLIYPQNTVLDDSIGCVLWFTARGRGVLEDGTPYQSAAKILLSGVGADELLAGYARHRSLYENHGIHMLETTLLTEMERISSRNCGRDDRVVGFHRKYIHYPFLSPDLVRFLFSLPASEKIDISLPRGVGEKILLRRIAAKLGLESASLLPKRAMQFGSRFANLEGKEKGSDICERLCAAFAEKANVNG